VRRPFALLASGLILLLLVLRVLDPAPVVALREAYFDQLQRLAPRQALDPPVRVVDIDEASLAEIGQWPWPRNVLADLVDRLHAMGAAVVAFDVLFPEPDRMSASRVLADPSVRAALGDAFPVGPHAALDNDLKLAAAMAGRAVVLGVADAGPSGPAAVPGLAGLAEVGDPARGGLTPLRTATRIVPALADAAAGVGSINVAGVGEGGVIREVPLLWRVDGDTTGVLPSLAVEALRLAAGETTLVLFGGPVGAESLGIGPFEAPVAADGTFRVHYRPDDPALYVSARDVLDPAREAEVAPRVAGQIVFVGTSAAGLLDIRQTALGQTVPGVSIHAQIVEQIIAGAFLRRSDVTGGIELCVLVLMGGLVALRMARQGPVASVTTGAGAAITVVAASWYAFSRQGVLLDATFPLTGGFLAFSVLSIYQYAIADREKRLIRQSFSRYVSPAVLSQIEKRDHRLELGGELREVTVMFADIRNFTALSETMAPQALVALLNDLFSDLSRPVLAEEGTIDKFIGDGIMAFWNAPLDTDRHHRKACLAALKMRAEVRRATVNRARRGEAPVTLAIGLASGVVCVGNMGSRERFNYSVVGDTVNQAARIETACRHAGWDILVSDAVAQQAADLAFLPAGALELKGVSTRVQVHALVGGPGMAGTAEFRAFRAACLDLIGVLSRGAIPADARVEACAALGARLDPGLRAYIDRMVARPGDFAVADGPAVAPAPVAVRGA